MKKLILLFLLAFSIAFSQGFEVSDSKLYVQDGGGTVELTPLQGAHIVGNSSAFINTTDAINIDISKAWSFEIKVYIGAYENYIVWFFDKSSSTKTRAYSGTSGNLVIYDDSNNLILSYTFSATLVGGWHTLKLDDSTGLGTVSVYIDDNLETTFASNQNFVIDRFLANNIPAFEFPTGSYMQHIKITQAGVLANYWLPTPNIDSDRNPSILLDIVGGNHATWTGATLADIATRSNAVIAPENDMGYNTPAYFNGLDAYLQKGAVASLKFDGSTSFKVQAEFVYSINATNNVLLSYGTSWNGFTLFLTTTVAFRFAGSVNQYNAGTTLVEGRKYTVLAEVNRPADTIVITLNGVEDLNTSIVSTDPIYNDGLDNLTLGAVENGTARLSGFMYSAKVQDGNGVDLVSYDLDATDWLTDKSGNGHTLTNTNVTQEFPIPANPSNPSVDAFGVALGSNAGVIKRDALMKEFVVPTFDGSAYVNFGEIPYVNNISTGDFTVGLYTKYSAVDADAVLFSSRSAGNTGITFFQANGGELTINNMESGTAPSTGIGAAEAYADDAVHSFIGWRESAVLYIEADDGTIDSVASTVDISATKNTVIGALQDGTAPMQVGNIWYLFFIDRALTSTERTAYYADGTMPSDVLIIPCTDEGNEYLIHGFQGSTKYDGAITSATHPDFWANTVDHPSAAYNLQYGFEDSTTFKVPADASGNIPGTTTTVSNPSGDWFNGGTDSTTVIDWNPYDLKEINDSYAAGSNSWGVNDYAYGDTLDGTYFQNTISTNYESIFFIYDTDGTTILGKYLYEAEGGYGNQRQPRLWRTIRTPR